MTTLVFTHPSSLEHVNPRGHPERVDRMRTLLELLARPEYSVLGRAEAPAATEDQIARAHGREHIQAVRDAVPEIGWNRLDSDTYVSPGSYDAALFGAGAVIGAVNRVIAGDCRNAFCAVRPPGHHAERARAMGFCYFGNVAVAALHAIEEHGLARVAIVDFDVHHGNGTQDIFKEDARVLFASTHQMPLYPGTGHASETGVGNLVNAPLAPGQGSNAFRAAMTDRILPAIDSFQPELILVSAGFDAHKHDPLAQINLRDDDYAWVTGQLLEMAERDAGGRLVSSLEGGYDLGSLESATAAHLGALAAAGESG